MVYTKEDARREVGNSTDLIVGLETSVKKWEQIVTGDRCGYPAGDSCGVCFVLHNLQQFGTDTCHFCHKRFGGKYVAGECQFMGDREPEETLQLLKDTLQHERWHFGSCISSRPTP